MIKNEKPSGERCFECHGFSHMADEYRNKVKIRVKPCKLLGMILMTFDVERLDNDSNNFVTFTAFNVITDSSCVSI